MVHDQGALLAFLKNKIRGGWAGQPVHHDYGGGKVLVQAFCDAESSNVSTSNRGVATHPASGTFGHSCQKQKQFVLAGCKRVSDGHVECCLNALQLFLPFPPGSCDNEK